MGQRTVAKQEFNQISAKIDPETGERVAVIRTSDRIQFKKCRRRWGWNSHLRDNLQAIVHADPLWLGSAMHYALEDFHGDRLYGTAGKAVLAYAEAFAKTYPKKVPPDWKVLSKLGFDMMEYYEMWLEGRSPLKTLIIDGKPQLEVNIKIPITWDLIEKFCQGDQAKFDRIRKHYDRVEYSMQLDRVAQDENGDIWIVEYKSAKIMSTTHYLVDPQVSTYCWGTDVVYKDLGLNLAGVIYQQHKKALPKGGRILQNGSVSSAKNQSTTHRLYRQTLIDVYGGTGEAPDACVHYLNELAKSEDYESDAFIRRDRVYRNAKTSHSEAIKILQETVDMLDPLLPLYPNPSRDCAHMCSFLGPCVSLDDGSDWKHDMMLESEPRPDGYDGWRKKLPSPEGFKPEFHNEIPDVDLAEILNLGED